MSESIFRAKAPKLMGRLLRESFGFSVEDAAAIAGNAGHESGGFTKLQEIKPVVPGSRGGYGWFQWTGPRRRSFEAFCADMKLLPSSDAANIEFVVHELKTTERKAITAVKAAVGLKNKVRAFEQAFERAGVKHYASRDKWAEIALDAYKKGATVPPPPDIPAPEPKPAPVPTPSYKPSIQLVMGAILAIAAAIAAYFLKG